MQSNTNIDDLFDHFDCSVSTMAVDSYQTSWPVTRRLLDTYETVKQELAIKSVKDLRQADQNFDQKASIVSEVKASFGLKLKLLAGDRERKERLPLADVTNIEERAAETRTQKKTASKLPPKPADRSSKEVIANNLLSVASYRGRRRFDRWKAGDRSVSIAYDKKDRVEKLSRSLDQRDKTQQTHQNEDFLKFMQELKKKSIFDGIIERPKKNSVVLQHEPLFNTSKYETEVTYDKIKNYLSTNRDLRGISSRSRDNEVTSNNYRCKQTNKQYAIFEDYPMTATTHNPSSTSRLKNITSFRERICKRTDGQPEESSYSRRMYMNASLLDSSRPLLPKPVARIDPRRRAPSTSVIAIKPSIDTSSNMVMPSTIISTSIYMSDVDRRPSKTARCRHADMTDDQSRSKLASTISRMPASLAAKIAAIVKKSANV